MTKRITALLAVSIGAQYGVALNSISTSRTRLRSSNRAAAESFTTDETLPRIANFEEELYSNEHRWCEEDSFDLHDSVTSDFMELQQSTGSEILDANLQQQLDGISHPNQFLDRHVADATPMEKLAMSSVTQQLPKAAVNTLAARTATKPPTTTTKRQKNDWSLSKNDSKNRLTPSIQYAGHRVSPQEEIELARIIQKGAALEATKEKMETKQCRSITRQEWADAAGLSAKELRRQIATYRRAKHLLVTANVGLVGAVVNQYWAKNKDRYLGITKEELLQEGSLGLLRAAELFDPSRGLRFSTYAVVWIKGTLSNSHVQELVRLPDRERRRWGKIQRAQTDIEAMEGSKAAVTIEKIAAATDLSPQEILFTQRKMQQAQALLSLDYDQSTQSRSGTESSSMVNRLHNDRAMQEEDMVERTQLQADVIAAMARNLDAREARLMRLRYGLSDGVTRSLTECAEAMGLSYTRVQTLAKQCLKKLREADEAESLQEYLLTIA